jgi:hypothetical protein
MAKEKKAVDNSLDDNATIESTIKPEVSQPPGLDLQDLALMLNLINISIKRGTFETSELREVLDVFDKLQKFLQFQVKLQTDDAIQKKGDDAIQKKGDDE